MYGFGYSIYGSQLDPPERDMQQQHPTHASSSNMPAAFQPGPAASDAGKAPSSLLVFQDALGTCPQRTAAEVLRLTAGANKHSEQLCEFVLENVLVHEAAAQQLQASVSDIVKDGQELLAISRQLQPLLSQLQHTAAAARELRALAMAARDLDAAAPPPPSSAAAAIVGASPAAGAGLPEE